jgi:hypothetical protein
VRFDTAIDLWFTATAATGNEQKPFKRQTGVTQKQTTTEFVCRYIEDSSGSIMKLTLIGVTVLLSILSHGKITNDCWIEFQSGSGHLYASQYSLSLSLSQSLSLSRK